MTSELSDQNLTSPDDAEVLVTKRRNRRPDKARDGPPTKLLSGAVRRPTERNTVRASDFGDADEN